MVRVLWSLVTMLSFCRPVDLKKVAAVGKHVSLHCMYDLHFADEYYNIEWSKQLPSVKDDYMPIIGFTNGTLHTDMYQQLKGRLSFNSPDPSNRDASITINDLYLSDTGTYVCSVQNESSEIFKKEITLKVSEEEFINPMCIVKGEPAVGNVTLECKSPDATLTYTWQKTSGNQMLPPKANVDTRNGDLLVKNITGDDYGQYICTVKNKVFSRSCVVLLENPSAPPTPLATPSLPPSPSAPAPPSDEDESAEALSTMAISDRDPAIVAAVTTILVVLAIVCAVAAIWYWCRRYRKYVPRKIEDLSLPVTKRANVLPQLSNEGYVVFAKVDAL